MIVVGMLVLGAPLAGQDAVSVTVWPEVSFEPAQVTVRVFVEPHPDNRALEVVAESAGFFRRSHQQLEGDRASRTSEFEYRDLPAGDYNIRVALIRLDGSEEANAVAKLKVRS
jgi:hypothetical protein